MSAARSCAFSLPKAFRFCDGIVSRVAKVTTGSIRPRPCGMLSLNHPRSGGRMTQNSTQESAANDERAIRDLIATWMEASRAGDTAKVLSLMADDVVFQVP